jgi:hypothetical protein
MSSAQPSCRSYSDRAWKALPSAYEKTRRAAFLPLAICAERAIWLFCVRLSPPPFAASKPLASEPAHQTARPSPWQAEWGCPCAQRPAMAPMGCGGGRIPWHWLGARQQIHHGRCCKPDQHKPERRSVPRRQPPAASRGGDEKLRNSFDAEHERWDIARERRRRQSADTGTALPSI